MKPARVRAEAARIVASLLNQHGSLANLLPKPELDVDGSSEGHALLRELCFGTCRWYYSLEYTLNQLIDKPIRNKDADIHCLLLVGLYQLSFLRLPDYAAINETVNATVVLKKPWAKKLLNGVLREFQRRQAQTPDVLPPGVSDAARLSYPDWLFDTLKSAWPEHYEAIMEQGNQHPPMTLRVNQRLCSVADYLLQLESHGIAAHAGRFASTAIYLEKACPVTALPGFAEGLVSVQDEASQLIPDILALSPGIRVLDACAAPGGKTCHMLEHQPDLAAVVALDVEERRLARLSQNLERLRLQSMPVSIVAEDATAIDQWWDGQFFDRILLDAPCSATGIIRRQPDVKVLRRASDIPRLNVLQGQLQDRLWTTLKPGGLMLYTTCSILPAENSRQIELFLQRTPDAQELSINAGVGENEWGHVCTHGRQLFPENWGPDGFFYALLKKSL